MFEWATLNTECGMRKRVEDRLQILDGGMGMMYTEDRKMRRLKGEKIKVWIKV